MFSQNNEERIIRDYFGPSFVGTFLDIGANDGQTFSNTRALALSKWKGTCVDASPVAFKALSKLYNGSEYVECIEGAVTTLDGTITLHQASDTLLSSLDPSQPNNWKSYGFEWTPVEVRAMTFATMLEISTFKTFDFVSIDAEGHDLEIIRQMDMDALGVRLLCVEHGNAANTVKAALGGFKVIAVNDINIIMGR